MQFGLDQAVVTLSYWRTFGTNSDWVYSYDAESIFRNSRYGRDKRYKGYQVVSMNLSFQFEFPPWSIQEDSWQSYREKITKAFQAKLNEYREQQSVWLRYPGQYMATNNRNPSHFDWMVDYQINDLNFTNIAEKYGGSTQKLNPRSVSDAICNLAMLMGFTIRRSSKGRPKKTPSS